MGSPPPDGHLRPPDHQQNDEQGHASKPQIHSAKTSSSSSVNEYQQAAITVPCSNEQKRNVHDFIAQMNAGLIRKIPNGEGSSMPIDPNIIQILAQSLLPLLDNGQTDSNKNKGRSQSSRTDSEQAGDKDYDGISSPMDANNMGQQNQVGNAMKLNRTTATLERLNDVHQLLDERTRRREASNSYDENSNYVLHGRQAKKSVDGVNNHQKTDAHDCKSNEINMKELCDLEVKDIDEHCCGDEENDNVQSRHNAQLDSNHTRNKADGTSPTNLKFEEEISSKLKNDKNNQDSRMEDINNTNKTKGTDCTEDAKTRTTELGRKAYQC